MSGDLGLAVLALLARVTQVPPVQEDPGSTVAGPLALLMIVGLGLAAVLLVRSMSGRMRRMRDNVDSGRWQGSPEEEELPPR